MHKLRLPVCLGIAVCAINSLIGCSDNGANTEPIYNSAENSWKSQFNVSINEDEGSLTIYFNYGTGLCSISEDSAKWISTSNEIILDMLYKVEDGFLFLWPVYNEDERVVFSGDNNSIMGIWKSEYDESTVKFTKDTYYTTEEIAGANETVTAVESEIDIATSYFIYDLYSCGSEGYTCYFSYNHFTKPSPDFIQNYIQNKTIDIHKQNDRFLSLTYAGKDLTINVEHVQEASQNNGRYYMAATIQTESDTCRFEYALIKPTKELCTTANLEHLSEFAYEGNDGKAYSEKYVNDNSEDFAKCVAALLK